MNGHTQVEGLIPLYALGSLTSDERASVESHIRGGCADCAAELAEMETVAGELALLLTRDNPPGDDIALLKRRISPKLADEPDHNGTEAHAKFEALLPLYASGNLGADLREEIERHLLAGCLECKNALPRHEASVARISMEQIAAEPPDHIGKALKARVASSLGDSNAATDDGQEVPIVGRHSEITVLESRLEKLARGDGGLALLEGDAGVGKSRLVETVMAAARGRGLWCSIGHCVATEAKPPFEPFAEILRTWARLGQEPSTTAQAETLEHFCRRMLERDDDAAPSVLARMLGLSSRELSEADTAGVEGAALERHIHHTVAEIVAEQARRTPSLLVIEDLHWADHSTLALLESLIPLVETHPLLILCTCRPGFSDTSGQIASTAREHYRMHVLDVRVGRLDEQDALVLARQLLGVDELPHEVAALIRRKAEGNPFYVSEIVRSLLRFDAVAVSDGAAIVTKDLDAARAYGTLTETLMSRADQLDSASRDALVTAAVIGRRFHPRVLARMLPEETNFDAIVDKLQAERFIRAESSRSTSSVRIERLTTDPVLSFEHALTQEILHSSIDENTREALHLRCAQAIETEFPERLSEYYGMLAYHYTHARSWEKATDYLLKAGELAAQAAASGEALYFFEEAHRIHKTLHGEGGDKDTEARLERNIAIALLNTGSLSDSIEHFNSALRLYGEWVPTTGVPVYIKFALDLPLVLAGLYTGRFGHNKPACDDRDRALFELMYNRCRAQNIADHERRVFDNIAAIRHVGHLDPSSVDNAAGILASAGAFFAFSGLSFGPSHRFLGLAKRLAIEGSSTDRFLYESMAFVVRFLEGDWSTDHDIEPAFLDEGLRRGFAWDADVYLGLNCERNIHQGRYEVAKGQTAKFTEIADRWGYEFANSNAYGTRAHLLVAQRRLEEAKDAAQLWHDLRDEDQIRVLALSMLTKVECLLGDMGRAQETIATLESLLSRTSGVSFPFYSGAYNVARLQLVLGEIEALARAGERPGVALALKSRRVARAALSSAKMVARDATETLRLAARLYWLLGQGRHAVGLWQRAIDTGKRLGEVAELGRIYRDVWQARAGSRSHAEIERLGAEDWLTLAHEAFSSLGLGRELDELETLRGSMSRASLVA